MTVIDLATRRAPVVYTVHFVHHWDDTMEFRIEDVADDERSRKAIADAMRRLAVQLDPLPADVRDFHLAPTSPSSTPGTS